MNRKLRRQQKRQYKSKAPFLGPNGQPLSMEQALLAASQLHQRGRLIEAEGVYQKVLSIDPQNSDALNLLGHIRHHQKRLVEARSLLEKSVEQNPLLASSHYHLGCVYKDLGLKEKAIASLEDALRIDPQHKLSLNQLASLTGDTEKAVAKDYVTKLFDAEADSFDELLVQKLKYKIYKVMWGMVLDRHPDKKFSHLLDLGCGTGLMAEEIADRAILKTGVDLSEKMLKKASEKGWYTDLYVDDIENFLKKNEKSCFDLITSADVFVYIGDLKNVFIDIASVLEKGGIFTFSSEAAEEHGENDSFVVHEANRFAHSKKYLDECIKNANLKVEIYQTEDIRQEGGKNVKGHLYLCTKT